MSSSRLRKVRLRPCDLCRRCITVTPPPSDDHLCPSKPPCRSSYLRKAQLRCHPLWPLSPTHHRHMTTTMQVAMPLLMPSEGTTTPPSPLRTHNICSYKPPRRWSLFGLG
ncbi:zinc finger protein [Sesbania bispinosa]|nr:zinc finger protein [Sesbania bispinosa]